MIGAYSSSMLLAANTNFSQQLYPFARSGGAVRLTGDSGGGGSTTSASAPLLNATNPDQTPQAAPPYALYAAGAAALVAAFLIVRKLRQ